MKSHHPPSYPPKAWILVLGCTALIRSIGATDAPPSASDPIVPEVTINEHAVPTNRLPGSLLVRSEAGIATYPWVHARVLYEASSREGGLYETRATITPAGDFLLMFPDGGHYGGKTTKVNKLLAMRSSDRGKTWSTPKEAFNIDYNQHGFIPLIPRGTKRLYAFGTQPVWDQFSVEHGKGENAPIGFRSSDDDGHTWSKVSLIRPENFPEYRGMSVMRMTETDRGTWLLGTHDADWSQQPLQTHLYLLRSTDHGKTWQLLPGKPPHGWQAPGFGRMDEGRPLALGGGNVLLLTRTPEGHLWSSRSQDDGQTWTDPAPTPLVHPDAPPMLFTLSDQKTLIAFHHNRAHTKSSSLSGDNKVMMADRSEIWFSTSTDGGVHWTEPRFVLVNVLGETLSNPWRNYNCSYLDAFATDGTVHVFLPHRWQRVLYLTLRESDLTKFPTSAELWR
ncbi:MAG: sialidase family protein [Opitutus sp.]